MTAADTEIAESLNRHWYVIHTRPRQETVAETHLSNQGFEVYLPRAAIQRRHRGRQDSRLQSVITAYFPRYLFVRFDAHCDNWGPIRSTRGVSALVGSAGKPRPVPEDFIHSLRGNEDEEQIQRLKPPCWQTGDEVEIEQGPFAGYRCIFQAQRSADRVAVLLNLIGRSSLVTLNGQDLRLPGG